jgi:outer membrane protein TolC
MKANTPISRIALILLVLAGTGALAQTHHLQELLDEGQKNYPLVKARDAERNSAAWEAKAAASEYLPRISAQHQYTYATSNSMAGAFYPNPTVISPSGGIRAETSSQATWGSYTSALLEWNVFNFGKVSGSVKAARAQRESADAAYANEVFQHQIRIADAYLLTLMTDKLAAIQHANLERALRFRQVVEAGVRAGLRAGVDSALAHAEYEKAKILFLESERNSKTQTLRLMELAGAADQGLYTLDSMRFYTELPRTVDSIGTISRAHPLLRSFQIRAEATRARSIAVRRSFLPSVTLVGAAWARGSGVYNDDSFHTSFSDGTKYQVNNYLLGIATRWTISDYVPIRQRYKSEYYRAVRDQELYQEQNLRIHRQVRETDMQYGLSLQQAYTAPQQLTAARQAYQQASARYKSGLTDLPTLLQSMVSLNRAEADLAVAYSNVWRTLLAVAAAQGDFAVFLQAVE